MADNTATWLGPCVHLLRLEDDPLAVEQGDGC